MTLLINCCAFLKKASQHLHATVLLYNIDKKVGFGKILTWNKVVRETNGKIRTFKFKKTTISCYSVY